MRYVRRREIIKCNTKGKRGTNFIYRMRVKRKRLNRTIEWKREWCGCLTKSDNNGKM